MDPPAPDPECVKVCEAFLDGTARGKNGSLETLPTLFVDQSPETATRIRQFADESAAKSSAWGNFLKCEVVHTVDVGGVLRAYYYGLKWEKKTFFVCFHLYRPGKEWQLLRVNSEPNCIRLLGKITPESSSAEPLAARSKEAR
jgi:hypothetical protein